MTPERLLFILSVKHKDMVLSLKDAIEEPSEGIFISPGMTAFINGVGTGVITALAARQFFEGSDGEFLDLLFAHESFRWKSQLHTYQDDLKMNDESEGENGSGSL